jgi:hypothetical protein
MRSAANRFVLLFSFKRCTCSFERGDRHVPTTGTIHTHYLTQQSAEKRRVYKIDRARLLREDILLFI